MARQGYHLLAGEKEARAASERLYYDVSDRRRNFPDYDGSPITYKTYSDSGQIGEALGEVDFENVFKRNWSSVKISDSDFEKILPLSYAAMLLSVACCI